MKKRSRRTIGFIFIIICFFITYVAVHQSTTEGSTVEQVKDIFSKRSTMKPSTNPVHGTAKTKNGLNIRKGPDASYDIVHVLAPDTVVTIEALSENNWVKIKYINSKKKTVTGFVNSKYLTGFSDKTGVVVNKALLKEDKKVDMSETSQKKASASERYAALSDVLGQFECKTVIVKVKIDGVITEKYVKTCKNRQNGSWGQ